MNIAINLFSDKRLLAFIDKMKTSICDCDVSGQKNVRTFNLKDSMIIAENLASIINLYSIYQSNEPKKTKKLYELIRDDWNLFSTKVNREIALKLLENIFAFNQGIIEISDLSKPAFISDPDDTLKNKYSIINCEWSEFSRRIKMVNRFHFDAFNSDMFDKFLETIIAPLPKGIFYRGRICGNKLIDNKDMLAPPPFYAKSSRVSPKYISTLYLCNDISIVPNECRASCNDYMTIAQFELPQDYMVFDLRLINNISPFDFPSEELFVYYNLKTIKQIALELGKPMTSIDSDIEYIPIQYLCEYMKFFSEKNSERKIVGITYKSVMTKSFKYFNLAAFSGNYFNLVSSCLYKIVDYKPLLSKIA